jgi:DNA primase
MGYLILPFYSQGRLTYFNARLVIGNGPRYNNPPKSVTGLGKEFLIYNVDALELYNQIYICEGVFNALTMGERAIATMGKSISRYQVNLLIKCPAKRFILLLDPDAKKQSIDLALKLVNFKSVKVVYLPEGKDANDIGRKEVMKLVWKTRYQDYQDLIKLKNEL